MTWITHTYALSRQAANTYEVTPPLLSPNHYVHCKTLQIRVNRPPFSLEPFSLSHTRILLPAFPAARLASSSTCYILLPTFHCRYYYYYYCHCHCHCHCYCNKGSLVTRQMQVSSVCMSVDIAGYGVYIPGGCGHLCTHVALHLKRLGWWGVCLVSLILQFPKKNKWWTT